MTIDTALYEKAVKQLVDCMDPETERPYIKVITVQRDHSNYDSWIAYAILENRDTDRLWTFQYAIYFNEWHMDADGF